MGKNAKEIKVISTAKPKKNPYKNDIISDDMGQWKYPGQPTRIHSGDITMNGVPYPVLGVDDLGNQELMLPGMDYTFPGQYVDEFPMARNGGTPKSLKKYTNKNIKSSINYLMRRNETLFGPSGKKFYRPMQGGGAQTPEEWENEIRAVEGSIGNPSTWTLESHKMLQDKLNAYKAWRENTTEGKAVVDYHNEPNEYVIPLPSHLQAANKGELNPYEKEAIAKVIMNRNKDKDFVQRAYAVGDYPDSKMFTKPDDNNFGERNSHLMGWGDDDQGQAYMYPSIFNDEKEAIKVPNQYADYMSDEGYKKATGMIKKNGGATGWLDEYQPGGSKKKEPIYVTDPNDPRLKAYRDSSDLVKLHNPIAAARHKAASASSSTEYHDVMTDKGLKSVLKSRSNLLNDADVLNYAYGKDPIKPIGYQHTSHLMKDGWNGDQNYIYGIYKPPVQPVELKPKVTPTINTTSKKATNTVKLKKAEPPVEEQRTVTYTDKGLYDKAAKAEKDSSNLYNQYLFDSQYKTIRKVPFSENFTYFGEKHTKPVLLPNGKIVNKTITLGDKFENDKIKPTGLEKKVVPLKGTRPYFIISPVYKKPVIHNVYKEPAIPEVKQVIQQDTTNTQALPILPSPTPIVPKEKVRYRTYQEGLDALKAKAKEKQGAYPNVEDFDYTSKPKKKNGGWLDEYQPGGQKVYKDPMQAWMEGKGRPTQAEAMQTEVNKRLNANAKHATISPDYRTEKQKDASARALQYIEDPSAMDYFDQIGYMPSLALSNPFNMGEKLKEIRKINSDETLSGAERFKQLMSIGLDAGINGVTNALTEGLAEGLLPGAIDKLSKLGKAKGTAKVIPNVTPAPNKKYFPISAEEKKDLSGFLERRQFLKELQEKELVGKNLNLNEAAKFERNTKHVTQKALDHDMAAYRAVTGKVPPGGKGYNDVGNPYDMSSVAHGNDISEFDNMIKAGVNMDDPISIAKYQATHVPMQNYAYRSGLPRMSKADGIYAAATPAKGYGDYLFKIKPKEIVDYSQGNYRNWLDQYMNHPTLSKEWESVVNQWNAPSVRTLKSSIPKTYVGKKGDQIMDIDQTFPFIDTKKLNDKQKQELNDYIKRQKEEYEKGWIDDYYTARPKAAVNVLPKGAHDVVNSAGIPNPLAIADRIIPRPFAPGQLLGMDDSWNNYSPLNFVPGYGRKLEDASSMPGKFVGFRKFGNSMDDVIERQVLGPKDGNRMGAKQIMKEGNWAEPGNTNEAYHGVFEATMNPQIEGSDIKLERWPKRNGVVGTTKDGNVDIPITDPGLSFNRRLPFSKRYVPIDKQKLIDKKFQLATQLPYVQSLVEKYGIWAGGALVSGYVMGGKEQALKNLKAVNKYSIDPVKDWTKEQWNELSKQVGDSKAEGGQVNWLDEFR